MTESLARCLGRSVSELLSAEPFSGWELTRSVEGDPKPEIWYEFEGHGVDVICDISDCVQTIFVRRGDGETLIDIPFVMNRNQVLERLGPPSSSSGAVSIPGIGDRGAWDCFAISFGVLHVQYRLEDDSIDMLTIMRPDAVPPKLPPR